MAVFEGFDEGSRAYVSGCGSVRVTRGNQVDYLVIVGVSTRHAYGRGKIFLRGVPVAAQSLNLQTNLTIGVVSTI